MAILPKAIYRFNEIPIKIPTQFFIDLEQFSNSSGITRKARIAKTLLNNKKNSEESPCLTSSWTTEQ
jgi:predicted ribonuclease YlaK